MRTWSPELPASEHGRVALHDCSCIALNAVKVFAHRLATLFGLPTPLKMPTSAGVYQACLTKLTATLAMVAGRVRGRHPQHAVRDAVLGLALHGGEHPSRRSVLVTAHISCLHDLHPAPDRGPKTAFH